MPAANRETLKTAWAGVDRFHAALLFCLVFHIAHAVALPILATYDSHEYVRLGRLAAALDFSSAYTFQRPPLYPLLLSACFRVFGFQALSAQLPNLLLGFLGIVLTGLTIRRLDLPNLAALAMILLACDPILITYEHAVLTEAGCFFFIALILCLSFRRSLSPGVHSAALGLALAAAFYWRPTLLYLAPVVALLQSGMLFSARRRAEPDMPFWSRRAWGAPMGQALAIILIPYLLAYPWNRALANSPDRDVGGRNLLNALLKQAILPPEKDPLLDPVRPAYAAALQKSTHNGKLDLAGIDQYELRDFIEQTLQAHAHEGSRLFRQAILAWPGRYCRGVLNTCLLFMGFPAADDENRIFRNCVINEAGTGGKVLGNDHPLARQLEYALAQRTTPSLMSKMLVGLEPLYRMLLPLGWFVLIAGFGIGCWQRNWPLLGWCALPLAYLLLHAVALLAYNRYVAPVYPFVLASLAVAPALAWRGAKT